MKKIEFTKTEFTRTIVLTDFHGDLNALAKSLADYGLIHYNEDDFEKLKSGIESLVKTGDKEYVEKMIVKQQEPVRLFVLGDYVDRNNYSYHLIQFLQFIHRQINNIVCVFLMGNHDLLNFLVFTNPEHVYKFCKYTGQGMKNVTEFLDSMRVEKSVKNLIDLHRDELIELQTKFFRDKEIELPLSGYSIRFKYNHDYTNISRFSFDMDRDEQERFFKNFEKLTGVEFYDYYKYVPKSVVRDAAWNVGYYVNKHEDRNFIFVQPPLKNNEHAYYGDWSLSNFIVTQTGETTYDVQILDWRIISYVWRKHYGGFFKNLKYWFLENNIMYCHAGLTPRVMLDSFTLAPMYDVLSSKIVKEFRWNNQKVLLSLVKRTNKLLTQIISNALADFSFETLAGIEIMDVIGYSRGYGYGMPNFGGVLWSHFGRIEKSFKKDDYNDEREKMLELYTDFHRLTGINKIICGHTQYVDSDEELQVRYRKVKDIEETGLEYICIDNGCSDAYRRQKGSIVNGIEIDKEGNILTPTDEIKDKYYY